tara:strand:+ start:102 stop:503 length:402 start_codon:yes stop_codon:yes gene_type:complete
MGGKAVYAGISKKDKDLVLDTLSNGLFDVLQRSNYDATIREFVHTPDDIFRKQTAISNKQNNSMASFIAGVLEQHKQNAQKDFSVKQLEGISASTRYFNIIDPNKHQDIEFEDVKKITPLPGGLDKFFSRGDQ